MQALSNAVMAGASDAVTLCIKLLGALCLWGGLMEIAKASGLTATVSRMLSPLLRLLFPNFKKDDTAMNAVSHEYNGEFAGPWQCRHAARPGSDAGPTGEQPNPRNRK